MFPSAPDNYGAESCSLLCLPCQPPVLAIASSSGGVVYHSVLLQKHLTDSSDAADVDDAQSVSFLLCDFASILYHVIYFGRVATSRAVRIWAFPSAKRRSTWWRRWRSSWGSCALTASCKTSPRNRPTSAESTSTRTPCLLLGESQS
jgi:Nuclear pore component